MSGEAFITFVRRERETLLRPGAPPEVAELLGLDDAGLQRWAEASERLVSLPHASPNVFFPRVRVGAHAAELGRANPDVHHLRIVLTHVNFSDLNWRPYAWWRLGTDGQVQVDRQFTRNKKRKHTVVSTRPPLEAVPPLATDTDRAAAEAARWGADLSVSYMLISAVVERAAGLGLPGAVTYLPLPWLLRCAQRLAAEDGELADWCRALLAASPGRRIDPERAGLIDCAAAGEADVLDNAGNLALLALLGDTQVLGGAKMQGYWDEITERLAACPPAPGGVGCPHPILVPGLSDPDPVAPSEDVRRQLEALGVPYSQGLAVAEHGAFAGPESVTAGVAGRGAG